MDTIINIVRLARREEPAPRFAAIVMAGARTLARWAERARQRRALLALDDRMLADIGIARADVRREYDKPFWRA